MVNFIVREKNPHEFPYEYAANICLEYFDVFTIQDAIKIYESVEKIYDSSDLESVISLIKKALSWHARSMGFKKEGSTYIKFKESIGASISNEFKNRLKIYKEENGLQ